MKATKNTDRVVVKRLAYRDWVVLLDDTVVSRVTSGELAYAAATDMLDEKKGGSRPRPVRVSKRGPSLILFRSPWTKWGFLIFFRLWPTEEQPEAFTGSTSIQRIRSKDCRGAHRA